MIRLPERMDPTALPIHSFRSRIMVYNKGCHTLYKHRYHIVWATKYRYDVLRGELHPRIRDIICQTCGEPGLEIIKGVLFCDHVHMFISVPPQLALSDVMRRIKGGGIETHPAGISGPPQTLLGLPFLG